MENYNDISDSLLLKLIHTPTVYYYELCNLQNIYSLEIIKEIINSGNNTINNGNHLHALVYVTGQLINNDFSEHFYGSESYIFENLAIHILDELIKYDINLFHLDSNNKTPLDYLFHNTKYSRKKNKKFIKYIKTYY